MNWSCCSVTQLGLTICSPMDCSMSGLPAQTHVHWVSDAIQSSHPLLPPSPPALNLSQHQGLFQWVDSWHQVTKLLELQLQHQSFQWIFRIDFLQDWLVWSLCCPRNLESVLQHHSPKASVLRCSAFFMVQLLHPLMTTGKTTASTVRTFVSKMMPLLFNMLSRFIIVFLPRSKSFNLVAGVIIHSDFGAQEN